MAGDKRRAPDRRKRKPESGGSHSSTHFKVEGGEPAWTTATASISKVEGVKKSIAQKPNLFSSGGHSSESWELLLKESAA